MNNHREQATTDNIDVVIANNAALTPVIEANEKEPETGVISGGRTDNIDAVTTNNSSSTSDIQATDKEPENEKEPEKGLLTGGIKENIDVVTTNNAASTSDIESTDKEPERGLLSGRIREKVGRGDVDDAVVINAARGLLSGGIRAKVGRGDVDDGVGNNIAQGTTDNIDVVVANNAALTPIIEAHDKESETGFISG